MATDQTDASRQEPAFDEIWYLGQHPGVAEAVRAGLFRSGWEHYLVHGRAEGRFPAPLARIARSRGDGSTYVPGGEPVASYLDHNGAGFLVPTNLAVSRVLPNRVAMIGPLLADASRFTPRGLAGCPVDLIAVDNATGLPGPAPVAPGLYDFVVIHIPPREVISGEGLWRLPSGDLDAHETAFSHASERLERQLTALMGWNRERGVLTAVTNFLVPQGAPMGRLAPRHDLRNPGYFFSRLNEHLEKLVLRHRNAYVLDLDRLSASIGRRYIQDDSVFALSRASTFPFEVADYSRPEPMAALIDHYDIQWHYRLPEMIWAEALAMFRTVHQADAVRLIVADLDSLFRDGAGGGDAGGWALGVAEAMLYVRKRGIQLALIGRGDDRPWTEIAPPYFRRDDFAAVRLATTDKPAAVADVLQILNVPPSQTVLIDCDPVARDAVRAVFPDIRVLGRHPYYIRRVLLWSSETERPHVTNGSEDVEEEMATALVSRALDFSGRGPGLATPADWASLEQADPRGARDLLAALWARAMDNDVTSDQALAIQGLAVAIASADHGAERIGLLPDGLL